MRKNKKDIIFIFILLSVMGAISFFPFYLTIMISFKPVSEFFMFPPKPYTLSPTFENYRDMYEFLQNLWTPFSRYLFNTVFVTITVTVLQCFFCSMAGFILAKGNFKLKKFINALVVTALLYQSNVIYLMQYIVMSKLHIIDTYWAIILPYAAAPVSVFLMKQSVSRMPDSIIESAKVDGAGMFSVCWRIVMPNQKPALATLMVFAFQSAWNNQGGNFIRSESLKTLPYAIQSISASGLAKAGASMAGSVFILIPPAVVFMICQGKIMETMTYSGIKE